MNGLENCHVVHFLNILNNVLDFFDENHGIPLFNQ